MFLNLGSLLMGATELVLNLAFMLLALTLGMVGMNVSRSDAQTVIADRASSAVAEAARTPVAETEHDLVPGAAILLC